MKYREIYMLASMKFHTTAFYKTTTIEVSSAGQNGNEKSTEITAK